MDDKKTYTYSYSAAENEEIKKIREKYEPHPKSKQLSKMDQLRKLDKSTHEIATMVSILIGVCGTLLLGMGLSMVLIETSEQFALGVVIGIIGIVIASLAYPAYQFVLEKRRKKIAPQIIKLTDELMNK